MSGSDKAPPQRGAILQQHPPERFFPEVISLRELIGMTAGFFMRIQDRNALVRLFNRLSIEPCSALCRNLAKRRHVISSAILLGLVAKQRKYWQFP